MHFLAYFKLLPYLLTAAHCQVYAALLRYWSWLITCAFKLFPNSNIKTTNFIVVQNREHSTSPNAWKFCQTFQMLLNLFPQQDVKLLQILSTNVIKCTKSQTDFKRFYLMSYYFKIISLAEIYIKMRYFYWKFAKIPRPSCLRQLLPASGSQPPIEKSWLRYWL